MHVHVCTFAITMLTAVNYIEPTIVLFFVIKVRKNLLFTISCVVTYFGPGKVSSLQDLLSSEIWSGKD